MDAICGADPDPAEIVSVESGGLGNFEEWMLGNLQKAFDEVDGKSQAARECQNGNTTRTAGRERCMKKGSRCWPTRKVGRAEKLLPRWHGPYVVIR